MDNKISETKYIPYLDGWRGLAILLVLISHFIPIIGFDAGRMGVEVFFVLSGSLMARLLYIKNTSLISFYKRRIARVFPTFIIYILVVYSIYSDHVRKDEFFATLFFIRTYLPTDLAIWPQSWPIGHIWSLNVEEHSYIWLSLGVLISNYNKNQKKLLNFFIFTIVGILAFNIGYSFYPPSSGSPAALRSECASFGLIVSVFFCYIRYKFDIKQSLIFVSFAYLIALPLVIFCYMDEAPKGFNRILAPIILAYLVNSLGEAPKYFISILNSKILRFLGVSSFSLYLWQQLFHFMDGNRFFLLVGAIFCGIISFHIIEKPMRFFLNKNWDNKI